MIEYLDMCDIMPTFAPEVESWNGWWLSVGCSLIVIYSRLQRHTSTFRWKNVELSTVTKS